MDKYNITGEFNITRDIKVLRARKKRELEPVRTPVVAEVFEVGGSIDVPNRPGYVWVHEFGRDESPAQALAGAISVQAGDWVKVIKYPKEPYQWRIIDYYTGNMEPGQYNLIIRHLVGPHAANHQWPTEALIGSDAVAIYQPAMQMLKTTGDGSTLTVSTQSYIYQKGGVRKYFSGHTTDLTSSVPGAGLSRKVLIYLDDSTNLLKTLDGDTHPSGGPVAPPYPVLPQDGRPSAYVQLTNGQTAITTVTHVEDARDFLFTGFGTGAAVPAPTGASQILMSDDSLQWIAVYPVISAEDGNIVTSESKIVYGS